MKNIEKIGVVATNIGIGYLFLGMTIDAIGDSYVSVLFTAFFLVFVNLIIFGLTKNEEAHSKEIKKID